jgi:FkbM family methyltransferase
MESHMHIKGTLALNLTRVLHEVGIFALLDRRRDSAELSKAGQRQSFSQFGEDLLFREYFGDRQGTYVEIGGNHPIRGSHTYLLYRMGWSGVVVEPIHRLYAKHKQFRPRDIQVRAAGGESSGSMTFYEMIPSVLSTCDLEEAKRALSKGEALLYREYTVPVMTVAQIYREYLAARPIDLLSIDTEGHDMAVLRGVDWTEIRPKIVICEARSDLVGAEMIQFLAAQGYEHLKSVGSNLLFAPR